MRLAKSTLIIGTNGVGKTTILEKIISKMPNPKKLIVTPDPMEWRQYDETKNFHFEGIRKIVYYDGLFKKIFDYYTNGVLVFDDYRSYLSARLSERDSIAQLCQRKRQKMIDIFIVAHGFSHILPRNIFANISDFVIFKTTDNPKVGAKYLNNPKFFIDRVNFINEKSKKDIHYFEHIKP